HAQELAGGTEKGEVGARPQELREGGCCLDHLLEVVDEKQHVSFTDVLGEAVLGAERVRDQLVHKRWITERAEPDPEDAGLVLGKKGRRGLEREPRLTGAARAGQRQQASS